jgi:hypothetical protein
MGYSIDPISDNCYSSTTVLINKLDIRDEETLNEVETLATYINASKLEDSLKALLTLPTTRRSIIPFSLTYTTGWNKSAWSISVSHDRHHPGGERRDRFAERRAG